MKALEIIQHKNARKDDLVENRASRLLVHFIEYHNGEMAKQKARNRSRLDRSAQHVRL